MKRILFLLLAISLLFGCNPEKTKEQRQYVVMLSMDGFRWDYTEKVPTPNFDKLAAMGVKAKSLKPCFPTKTFPNHYSIATGLYPDHHGIVLNSFFDPESNRNFSIMDRETVQDGSFYDGEPIWVTAEKQGIKSGSYFWVGSEAEIDGFRPTYWKTYTKDFPYKQQIDSVISWLQKPEDYRPQLILWYFDEPDQTGHIAGPDSQELESKIIELDFLLGYFINEIEKLPFREQINVIVTSDHGMSATSEERKIVLYDFIPNEWVIEVQGYNPNFNMKAKEGYIDSIYFALKDVEGITIWKTGELPERLQYGHHIRTLDLVVVADSSWSVELSHEKNVGNGAHGYDNNNRDMQTIFYAYGLAFKENYISETFNNVDIYPLICEIIKLKPAPVDGKIANVRNLLKE
ncbi:MAG: ectonucleotide pyrophosphatase/phosphodiesterase [Bacteroidales bacterium]